MYLLYIYIDTHMYVHAWHVYTYRFKTRNINDDLASPRDLTRLARRIRGCLHWDTSDVIVVI